MRILSRTASKNLTQGSLAASLTFGEACKLLTVYVHASTPITEEVAISFESQDGAVYNTLIATKSMVGMADYVFAADGAIAINENESIKVSVTNANLIGTIYVTAKAEK